MAAPTWAPPHHTTPSGLAWPGEGGGLSGWDGQAGLVPGWGEERMHAQAAPPAAPASTPDPVPLDLAISFLKKRDGIDKVLKLIRYTAKLALVTTHAPIVATRAVAFAGAGGAPSWPTSPAYQPRPSSFLTPARLSALESSIGDARKAYRLGKWLQGVAGFWEVGAMEALSGSRGLSPALAALAALGDACYFFLEQGTWLVRARVAPAEYGPGIMRASATAELVSYLGSSGLALVTLDGLNLREVALRRELAAARLAWPGENIPALLAELEAMRAKRLTLRLALLQDACDALLATTDLRKSGRGGLLDSKPLLAVAGLVSALLGTRKVWLATVKGAAEDAARKKKGV